MSSKKIRQNKEAIRRVEKRSVRSEDDKESALKAQDARKARAMPLSAASRKVLREEENSKKPAPGFSEFVRNKHEDSPKLAHLPKETEKAKVYARNELRATPKPTEYWNSLQQ